MIKIQEFTNSAFAISYGILVSTGDFFDMTEVILRTQSLCAAAKPASNKSETNANLQ